MKKVYKFKNYELTLIEKKNIDWYKSGVLSTSIFENQKHDGLDGKKIIDVYLEKLLERKVFKYYIMSDDEVLGIVSVSFRHNEIELGYYLDKEHRGRGIMSYILRELILVLDDGRVIVSYTEKDNEASKRILESLDFYPRFENDKLKYYYGER